ncbi:MAG TPA: M1 family aminopeptidase [Ignavibacteria bacterium]|nr:M1 family aminopeptidase [Ignavibacteria bacterium]
MLNKLLFSILIISVSSIFAHDSQVEGSYNCYLSKTGRGNNLFLQGDSPNTPRHKYDVIDYKINLDIWNCFITPFPKNFTGSVIIKFRIDTALSSIDLHAVNTSLQVNNVGMSGVSFTHINNILTVTLDRTYNPGEITNVLINYNHLNVTDGAFYVGGGGVMTDTPPEGARKWFPCYDRPFDKATVDITAKVPSNVKLGSNGRLNDSTVTGDTIYYHWISKDPVATYLIVLSAKINYKLDIIYWHKLSNPLDSVPIRFYYVNSEAISTEGYILNMITYYSQKFSEHAFEKNGFTTAAAPGFQWAGMENQTLITMCSSCWTPAYISHEFSHQWFGDAVTCGTWADVWLNEGFATYCEALWAEYNGGYTAYKNTINSRVNSYFSGNPGWPIYNPEWAVITPNINTLYNYSITYCKGAGVLHMLRYLLQDTTIFFNCLREYCSDTTDFKYKNAVTDDFVAKVNSVSGQNLTWFFDQWVKQPNHPVYQNYYKFADSGNGNWAVWFQVRQIQTNTPFHRMPVVLKITFTSGPDTMVRVDNTVNNQEWTLMFNRQPATFAFDPNNDIVLKQGTTNPIGIEHNGNEIPERFALGQNYPNPFNPTTTIRFSIPPMEGDRGRIVALKIYNLLGQEVAVLVNEQLETGIYKVVWDANDFSGGVYLYEFNVVSQTKSVFKDVKKMVVLK